jgi:hypothetical protein
MIHHRHFSDGQNVRKYCKLASIPKFKTNIHDERFNRQQSDRTLKLSFEEVSLLRSLLRQLDVTPSLGLTEIDNSAEVAFDSSESVHDDSSMVINE